MTMEQTIARINELHRKKQTVGLNEAELQEQAELRKVYLSAIRKSLRAQLDQIEIVDNPDQSYRE